MRNKILFFAGSARRDSFNKKLARTAYEIAVKKGADATFIDLNDYEMPLYNGDLEDAVGLPDNAKRLKRLFVEHSGLFIASPEYNSSISPLLKNTLDWISRKETPDEMPLNAYVGKVAAISATSAGRLGGLRGLVPLRLMLSNIKVSVLPDQLAIPFYNDAFNKQNELHDESSLQALETLVVQLIDTVNQIAPINSR